MKIWGYWATLGWAVLAFAVGQFAALAIIAWWRPASLNSLVTTPYDGATVALFVLISNPITIALLAIAVARAHAGFAEYLALAWPSARRLIAGIGGLAVLIALSDGLLLLGGRALVTPFQVESYTTAATQGWLAALLIATIIVAPAAEEIMFRGFLFRGWARSGRSTGLAIVVISALWAVMHVQYDWTGVLQIFVVGLFLGWMRWRSGSTLLTLLLHALFNLEGTLETFVQMRFFI